MTIQEAAHTLLTMQDILILTHRRPDGDTIGSAAALCLGLRQLGKTAYVLPNEDAHHLFDPYFEGVLAPPAFQPQAVVTVDLASRSLIPRSAAHLADRIDLCLDHHGSNEGYAAQSCVLPAAAACGEIILAVLQAMGVQLDSHMAMLLYMAIATDTGCFVYSNTTPQTHRAAALLLEHDFDVQWVNTRHFRQKSLIRMQLESRLLQDMDLLEEGTLAFVYVTLALVQELGATEEDLDDISAFIGLLAGVKTAVTVRQLGPEECKISIRSDGKTVNASAVCAQFGGGGHPAAAGCVLPCAPHEVKAQILNAIRKGNHG